MCEMENSGNGKYVGTTYTSYWRKESELLKVATYYKEGHHATAFFAGTNPFPCFSMETTYGELSKWLQDHGWVLQKGSTKRIAKWERYTLVNTY